MTSRTPIQRIAIMLGIMSHSMALLIGGLAMITTVVTASPPVFAQSIGKPAPMNRSPVPDHEGPHPLSSWILEGKLIDGEEVVRGFLRPVMKESQNWSPDARSVIIQFLSTLGYDCKIDSEHLADGSVRATLTLSPITLVRHVMVKMNIWTWDRIEQPIFADEISKRMTLRPGSPLATDAGDRRGQLRTEADRLRLYLINDGFYDAKVAIEERPEGAYQSRLTVTVTPGEPYFIGSLTIDGNLAIESSELTRLFHHSNHCLIWKLCLGTQRFSRQTFLNDIQQLISLYQQRGYPGVRVHHNYDSRHSFRRSDKTLNLRIEVRERRLINVEFEGNTGGIPRERLLEQLTLSQVGSYDDVEVQASAEAVRSYYQGQGYFEAQITWERELFPEVNFERIVFFVEAGPRLRVRRVSMIGNRSLPAELLNKGLRTRIYKRIVWGDSGGYVTTAQLRHDARHIVEQYREAGFLDASVNLRIGREGAREDSAPGLAAAISGRLPARGLDIVFQVKEGRQSILRKIRLTFDGLSQVTERDLRKQLRSRPGDSFQHSITMADGERLQRFYFLRGFPRASVTTDIEKDGLSVTVTHRIIPSTPATIGKIAIRGNFKTRDWVILREMNLHEGQRLTLETAEIAQANLRQSGLFSTSQVTFVGQNDARRDLVNVLVRVEERHDYSLSYSAATGYATDSLLYGEATGAIPNLGGIGARLSLLAHYGLRLRQSDLTFQLPRWVMKRYTGLHVDFETSVSFREEDTRRFGLLTTQGLSLAISREARRGLFQGWLFSMRYDYRRRNNDIFLVRPAGNSDELRQTKVTTDSSTIGPRLVIDKRLDRDGSRNPLNPARGYRLEFEALFAEDFLAGSNRFLKLGFAGQAFLPLSKRLTLSLGLRYDHGVPLAGDSLLPAVERYFAGGDTTVRGYEEDRLITEIIENPLTPLGGISQVRVVPASGNVRLVQNLDLQIELMPDPKFGFPIASAIFLDTGMVTNSLINVGTDDLHFGLGIALIRWVSPVGSLSFEYAVPLNITLGNNPRGRFHINLGVLFN